MYDKLTYSTDYMMIHDKMQTKFGERSVWKIGDYTYVTSLPPVWRKTNDIDENSKIEISMDEEGRLIIEPVRNQGGKGDGKEREIKSC